MFVITVMAILGVGNLEKRRVGVLTIHYRPAVRVEPSNFLLYDSDNTLHDVHICIFIL